jgi:hypothetical protein
MSTSCLKNAGYCLPKTRASPMSCSEASKNESSEKHLFESAPTKAVQKPSMPNNLHKITYRISVLYDEPHPENTPIYP